MEEIIERLAEEAQRELLQYPIISKKKVCKEKIKSFLMRRKYVAPDRFFWPHAMLANAIECCHVATGEEKYIETLKQYYDRWIDKGEKISNVDNVMNGYTLIYLYQYTKDNKYLQALQKMVECLGQIPTAKDGSVLYRGSQPEIVYADTLGMICPFLCRYGKLVDDNKFCTMAVKQLKNFISHGMDERSGLPYHAYNAQNGIKLGIIGWGRAVGWLIMGLSNSLEWIPSKQKEYKELVIFLREQVDNVISHQLENGYFAWQLEAHEGHIDTSSTGMILYSVKKALQLGLLSEKKYERMIERGCKAMEKSVNGNQISDSLAECEALGCYPQIYREYPWGLASFLTLKNT